MPDIKFASSRDGASLVTLSEAIRQGLAPDGGLYVPTQLPQVEREAFDGSTRLADIARSALDGFFAGDRLQPLLGQIADAALDFPAPTTAVPKCPNPLFVLELFHAAFHLRPWVRIVVLYPKGQVSARQEQQLTCWGDNVLSLRIDGTFDDCQRLVKEAFVDVLLRAKHRFSSANSINIGRLLPQMVYYVASSLEIERRTGAKASYIIPAGNLGNRHGRRQSEQYGAHPRTLSDFRRSQRTAERGQRR